MHCKAPRSSGILALSREDAIRNPILSRYAWTLLAALLVAPPPAGASELKPEAVRGFDQYVSLTERRIQSELAPGGAFLWVDSLPGPRRTEAYARLQRDEVISERLRTPDPSGQSSTPGALIHHWVGTIFIPGVSLAQVLAVVEDYDRHEDYYKPHVMQAKTVEHSGEDFKVHYRLREKRIITIFLDADYDVHTHSVDKTHAYSNSLSTRIAQVENPGQPNERELPSGKDGGYMWRLNSYWRYFDTGQCEAISLSRDIPEGLNWLVGSFVETVPKESLEFTLQSTRSATLRSRAGP